VASVAVADYALEGVTATAVASAAPAKKGPKLIFE
jgi:hypothetical protein